MSINLDVFFSFIFISWRLITLQYCSGFCHTLTWISHGFTCIPHPDPPSNLDVLNWNFPWDNGVLGKKLRHTGLSLSREIWAMWIYDRELATTMVRAYEEKTKTKPEAIPILEVCISKTKTSHQRKLCLSHKNGANAGAAGNGDGSGREPSKRL